MVVESGNIFFCVVVRRGIDNLQLSIALRKLAIVGESLLEPILDIDMLDYQLQDMEEEVRRLEVVKREFIQENKKTKPERYAR